MISITKDNVNEVKEFLEKDVGNCIYLYLDLLKYGLENKNIQFWTDGDPVTIVLMRYFESMQVYTKEGTEIKDGAMHIIKGIMPKMISGPKWCIDQLKRCEIGNSYTSDEGDVYEFVKGREDLNIGYKMASEKDMDEIARLICQDEDFAANYIVEDLARQLSQRLKTGMGRNLIIREGNRIIAHIATYAEYDKIAVTSGLIVDKEYRDYPYGTLLENELIKQLLNENYRIYTMVHERKRSMLLKAQGHRLCGGYGKMMKKNSK